MRIENAGENAIIVYLGEGQSPEVSDRVQQIGHTLPQIMGDSLIDLVPSYASLLVVFNPLTSDHLAVRASIQKALATPLEESGDSGQLVALPVYYSTESGPDL
jgi:allophanate hydrolase subunit 1